MPPSWIALFPLSCLILTCATSGDNGHALPSREKRNDRSETETKCTDDDSVTFACDDTEKQCVPRDHVCNGIPDCDSGLDEAVETCGCLPNEFQCNKTLCVDRIKRCDIHRDCPDGSDEADCDTYSCPERYFKCRNHKCIPFFKKCDFEDDCGDGSDEDTCRHTECVSGFFTCDNKECILSTRMCDGHRNCKDGSDELQERCDAFYRCPTGFYVNPEFKCDGFPIPECKITHMDEAQCGNCSNDQHTCSNGQCLRQTAVCDGHCDCSDCKDEMACSTRAECNLDTHFICFSSKRCIPKSSLCDGHNDCVEYSRVFDEHYCHNSSDCSTSEGSIRCDGRCFPDSIRCSRFAHCFDGRDEEDCGYADCPPYEFQCDNHQCIELKSRCDGKYDCGDWSDEKNCETEPCPDGQVRCDSGQCIPQYKWCNHWPNCPDGSDEESCDYPSCTTDEFQCNNGECIPKSLECYNGKKNRERDGCDDKSHLIDCQNTKCDGDGLFKCLKSFCVDADQVCDGTPDCFINFWDEANCSYKCPYKREMCSCYHTEMNCENRNLTEAPIPHRLETITQFHLAGNEIGESLMNTTFDKDHLAAMTLLDLSRNGLKTIPPNMFNSLWSLTYLNLADNMISTIHNESFTGLKNVSQLFLQGNNIQKMSSYAFVDLGQLSTLDLSQQNISNIEINTFQGLRSLRFLNLSGNRLAFLQSGAFNGLIGLTKLDISNNQLALIEKHVFTSLPSLEILLTDEFRFCCMAHGVSQCYPEGDEFSSCEDLMSNFVLRVCIWVLGLMASLGNMLVIIWRARTVRGSKVHSFLIANLAIGDLLMGIYLVIIAVVDLYYRGVYILHEADWTTSALCRMAGFFSMFSSELSVLTLTVITLDRLCCIIFPLRIKRLGVKEAVIVMSLVWLLVFAIAYIPVSGIEYFGNFYGRSGVCLALPVTPAKPRGWEYSVAVFLVLNFLSFVLIAVAYVWMFLVAKETRSAVRSGESKTDSAMAKRMTLIVMTDFVCWVPIILLGFASMAGAHASNHVYAWIAVFILPINSAINPVLYTLSTAPFVGTVQKRARHFRKSFMNSTTADTKASYVDDRTVHSYADRRSSPRQGEAIRMKSIRVNAPGYSGKTSSDI